MSLIVRKTERLEGTVAAPPSKSYTHRAFFLGAMAVNCGQEQVVIENPSLCEDNMSTMKFLAQILGVDFVIDHNGDKPGARVTICRNHNKLIEREVDMADLKQRFDRLMRRRKAVAKLKSSIEIDERELGFVDTEHIDHIQGTDMEDWRCKKCGKEWASSAWSPCDDCHSALFAAIRTVPTGDTANERQTH